MDKQKKALVQHKDPVNWEPLPPPKSKKPISASEMSAIRRILCMTTAQKFIRCKARDQRIVRKLEAAGDFSHSEAGHVCADCRCRAIAGRGTRGDFYGLGEHTGHYGVGWCWHHERGRYTSTAKQFALNQMRDLQRMGRKQAEQAIVEVAKDNALIARDSMDIRHGLDLVKKTLQQFQDRLDLDKDQDDHIEVALKDLRSQISRKDFVDPEQGEEILEAIDRRLFLRKNLTETSGGRLVQMSDQTRMKLFMDFAKTLSSLTKDKVSVESADMVHVDEINVRLPEMINLVYRFVKNEEHREEFRKEFARIWMKDYSHAS